MNEPQKFEAGKVADLAMQIDKQIVEVDALRKAKGEAASALNSAEVRLANLQIELTRAVDGQLDMSTLKQRPAERLEA